jgi:hypothetical protein
VLGSSPTFRSGCSIVDADLKMRMKPRPDRLPLSCWLVDMDLVTVGARRGGDGSEMRVAFFLFTREAGGLSSPRFEWSTSVFPS